LLEDQEPRLHGTIAEYKRLQTWLGDDHNLFVLEQQLHTLRSPKPADNGRAQLHTRIEQRQHELRRKGLASGARLFAHSPKEFVKRHMTGDDQ
jgi:hypothetical protein